MSGSSPQRYEFGDLTLDLGRRQLFRGEKTIRLTKLDFDLLRALVVSAPNLVTRESLVSEVWGPRRVVTPENLTQRIKLLRRQLGDDAVEPRYIEGVRGMGYRLIPAVSAASKNLEARTAAADAAGHIARIRLPNSVAVLPLENLSPESEHAYFATGVHAQIIHELARLRNVNTIARSSVQVYAGSRKSVAEIAMELGVETVLEGSIRYSGDRVRVSVNLINPYIGTSLWSENYDRDLVDVFEIESDIAVNVADALRAELFGCERDGKARRPTASPEAYALYMQALGLTLTHDSGDRMRTILDRALELDPEFAEAYGLSAYLHAMSYIDTTSEDAVDAAGRDELESIARDYAARAIELDPTVAIAHAAFAMIDLVTWRWTAARRGFDRAHELGWSLDISPWLYSWTGEHAEAIERARHVVELSPNDWVRHRHLGVALAYAGEYESAFAALSNAAGMAPAEPLTLVWILFVQVARGNGADARERATAIERLLGNARPMILLPELSYAYRRLGMDSDARRIFDEVRVVGERREVGVGARAMVHLAIDDHEAALSLLDQAAERIRNHEPDQSAINLLNMKMNFMADPVLDEPEFRDRLELIRGD